MDGEGVKKEPLPTTRGMASSEICERENAETKEEEEASDSKKN
jgi:hypothetical protein